MTHNDPGKQRNDPSERYKDPGKGIFNWQKGLEKKPRLKRIFSLNKFGR